MAGTRERKKKGRSDWRLPPDIFPRPTLVVLYFENTTHFTHHFSTPVSAHTYTTMFSGTNQLSERRRHASAMMHESLEATRRQRAALCDESLRKAAACRAKIRPSAFLTVLPPEIRVMIYDIVYAEEPGSSKVNLKRAAPANEKAYKVRFPLPFVGN